MQQQHQESTRPRVLDVGNCDPDHASIQRLLGRFEVDVDRVMFVEEAVVALAKSRYDLVLVNRLIFADGSDGLPLIQRMKADARFQKIPVMMVSNYPEAQDRAVSEGAVRGFGKADLNEPRTLELLKPYLARAS